MNLRRGAGEGTTGESEPKRPEAPERIAALSARRRRKFERRRLWRKGGRRSPEDMKGMSFVQSRTGSQSAMEGADLGVASRRATFGCVSGFAGSQQRRDGRRTPQIASSSINPYHTLGVSEQADMKDIKKAYRKLAFRYHPDREGGSEAMFVAVNEAYELLKDTNRGKDINRASDSFELYWKFILRKQGVPKDQGKRYVSRSQWQSQLAGLRHRDAVRSQKQRMESQQTGHEGHVAQPVASDKNEETVQDDVSVNGNITVGDELSKEYCSPCGSVEDPGMDDFFEDTFDYDLDGATLEGQQAYSRLMEAARRRQSLNGYDARHAVRDQLAGLKRVSSMKQETDIGL